MVILKIEEIKFQNFFPNITIVLFLEEIQVSENSDIMKSHITGHNYE